QWLKEYNIAGAAKHFPGHGDTHVDSHYGLPEVDKSIEDLKKMELLPFQAAMDQDIDMIMTAHMMFPQIDDQLPSTLSENILTGLVRDDMGYEGVIITDAMNMAAIVNNFGEIEAAELAIEAGVDIVLMPIILREKKDVDNKLEPMVQHLVDREEEDEDFMARVNESVKRVLQLKEDRGILDYEENKLSVEEQVEKAKVEVGSDENRDLERKIARKAVTVVKNEDHVLPFKAKSGDKILLVGAYANEVPGMKFSLNRLMEEGIVPEDIEIETALLSNLQKREDVRDILSDVDYAVVISEI